MFMLRRSQFDKSEKWAYLAYFVSCCVVGSPSFLRGTSLLRRGFGVIEESGKPLPEVTPNSSKYRGGGVCEKFVNCYCYM